MPRVLKEYRSPQNSYSTFFIDTLIVFTTASAERPAAILAPCSFLISFVLALNFSSSALAAADLEPSAARRSRTSRTPIYNSTQPTNNLKFFGWGK